jgi:hypothetical protein
MFATLVTVALFAVRVLAADDIHLETPTFTQCKDVQLKWDKGTGPYNLIIVPAADPCDDAIYDLGDHDGKSMTWKVKLPAGQEVMMSLLDSTGSEAWSGAITVADSDDKSCVPKELLAAAAPTAAAVSSSAAPSASSAAPSSVVPSPTLKVPSVATTPTSEDTDTGSAVPIGAANAGTNPFGDSDGGANSLSIVGAPVIIFGSLFGAITMLL